MEKSIYRKVRDDLGLSREAAAERTGLATSRIERIESGTYTIYPEDVILLAEGYGDPALCNHYCTHECAIGKKYVPKVTVKDISQITLEILAALNSLNRDKERLVEIMVDGCVSEDELTDFNAIQENLDKMDVTIEALKLWARNASITGKIAKEEVIP